MNHRLEARSIAIVLTVSMLVSAATAQEPQLEIDSLAKIRDLILTKQAEMMELSREVGPSHPKMFLAKKTLEGLQNDLALQEQEMQGQEDKPGNEKLAKVRNFLSQKRQEAAEMTEKLGAEHPKTLATKKQVMDLEHYFSRLAKAEDAEGPELAGQLKKTMLRFADTMDQLGDQIKAIERLGNQIGAEKSESRKQFHESSELLFRAAKIHFAELEDLMAKSKDESMPDANSDKAEQARQSAESFLAQALESRDKAVIAAVQKLAALEYPSKLAGPDKAQEPRIGQIEARLSRIEQLLEKLLDKEGPRESTETGR
jgi:hypothetical protein